LTPPKNLAEALIQFQASVPTIHENDSSFHGKFANLPGVLSTINPALRSCGLFVSQLATNIDGSPALRTTLMHVSGERIEDVTPLTINNGKNPTQEWGKAMTYTRRYSLQAVLGLCVGIEDNDADLSQDHSSAPSRASQAAPVAPPPPLSSADREPFENELIKLLQVKFAKGETLAYLDEKSEKWNLKKGGSRVAQMTIRQLQECIDELSNRKNS
jgi:hypothetical protein